MPPTGLLDTLADLGVKAILRTPNPRDSATDGILQIREDGHQYVFALEYRTHAPYPSEITRLNKLAKELAPIGMPLFYAPYVSEGEAKALRLAGWSWADESGNLDIQAPGLRLRQRLRRRTDSKRISGRVLPRGSGGLGIVRYLIYGSTPEVRVGDIARRFEVTQPLVSQVLARLEVAAFAQRGTRSWTVNKGALLDAFLREYEGPGGRRVRLYGLDAPRTVAARITKQVGRHALVSGDVGADLITPWRVPTHLIVYLNREVRPKTLDLVEAEERSDANVVLYYPRDESIFRVPAIPAELVDSSMQIVHPTQLLWDLEQLGGEDRLEGRDRLRRWLLNSQ
jgi:hypothetical protein